MTIGKLSTHLGLLVLIGDGNVLAVVGNLGAELVLALRVDQGDRRIRRHGPLLVALIEGHERDLDPVRGDLRLLPRRDLGLRRRLPSTLL